MTRFLRQQVDVTLYNRGVSPVRVPAETRIVHGDDRIMRLLKPRCRLSLFAEMEHLMISRRTKDALATKKLQGISLGKPRGTQQHSIYDHDQARIVELLRMGVSARRISSHHLRYGSNLELELIYSNSEAP